MSRLDLIESRIKELIENSADFLPWNDQYAVLVHRLCEAIQHYLINNGPLSEIQPSCLNIVMNPGDLQFWKKQPDWEKALPAVFSAMLVEFGYTIGKTPELFLSAKNSLDTGDILIKVVENLPSQGKTGVVTIKKNPSPIVENIYQAKLITNGTDETAIGKPVTNLGRHSSNDIVFDDLRISRTHAQIRKSQDGYRIFDVSSTGGTFVNGERITSHLLRSGDVISLAGFTLIYVDEQNNHAGFKKESTVEIKVGKL
jgi:hypothetical protein